MLREPTADDIAAMATARGLTLAEVRDLLAPLQPYCSEDDQRAARQGDGEARSRLVKSASEALSMDDPIAGVYKITSDPPVYYLTLQSDPSERLHLGRIDNLDTQTKFRRRMLDLLDWQPPQLKPLQWTSVVVNALAASAVHEQPDESTTPAGLGRHWVAQYLTDTRWHDPVDLAAMARDLGAAARDEIAGDLLMTLAPFRDDRGLHVFAMGVQRVVRERSHGGEHPSAHEITRCMTAAGYRRVATKFPKPGGGGRTTRSTWIVDDDAAYG